MPGKVRHFGAKVEDSRCRGLLNCAAKFSFMIGIAAGILFTWQGITLQVQKFSVRPDQMTTVQAVAHWVHSAWTTAVQHLAPVPQTTFELESGMSARQLVDRWTPVITEASARFNVPATWIRAVLQTESGGRTMLSEDKPIVSSAGAMGLMQLMPGTYKLMRAQYRLGANPFNARDNVYAGAAYLHQLYQHYGYPAMFAAYNDGPGNLEQKLVRGQLLPLETRNYIKRIETALTGGAPSKNANPAALQDGASAKFTRPNGAPVQIKLADITAVRLPLQGEYPAGVNAVISVGRVNQAVRESYNTVKADMLEHGALGQPASGQASRFAALLAANFVRHAAPQPKVHTASKAQRGQSRHNQHRTVVVTARNQHHPVVIAHNQHHPVVTARHRVHGQYRLADNGQIHLHRISHHGRS